MNLADILEKENIFIADNVEDTDRFYSAYSEFLLQRGIIKNKKEVKRLFIKRENLHSTAIGKGAAAPHIFSPEFSQFLFSIAFIKQGVDFKATDQGNVYLVFLIMSDERDVGLHLKTLAHIGRLVKCTDVVDRIKEIQNPDADELYNILLEEENSVCVK
ncbi:MAG: PTS sugar transporter subunit IIA [Candidatus Aminicenantes bacterium]|jgi:mannitol/fructose-specific phosphotransferase system IIA component (Ntr-type)